MSERDDGEMMALYTAIVMDGWSTLYFQTAQKDIGLAFEWLEVTAKCMGVSKGQLLLKLRSAHDDLVKERAKYE